MKLPNWFKIAWWGLLLALVTWVLWQRYPDLVAGRAARVDIVVFVIWVALMLAPVFSEVSLLGIKLKQGLDEIKQSVNSQLSEMRNEIRNSIDMRTTVNNLMMPGTVPDSKLPDLKKQTEDAVRATLASMGIKPESVKEADLDVPKEATFLFTTRYTLENLLNAIASNHFFETSLTVSSAQDHRPVPFGRLVRSLSEAGIIDARLQRSLQEVYAICSETIHGRKISEAKINFVRDVGPELIATLSSIAYQR